MLSLVDEVAKRGAAAAGRVARWLRPIAAVALVAAAVICLTLVRALLGEGGYGRIAAIVIAVAVLIPFALILLNRRRLLDFATSGDALRTELGGLASAIGEQARATRLAELRDDLQKGGVRSLVKAGGELQRLYAATGEVRDRSDALRSVFALAGFTGLAPAIAGTVMVCLAAPVAVVIAIVLWST